MKEGGGRQREGGREGGREGRRERESRSSACVCPRPKLEEWDEKYRLHVSTHIHLLPQQPTLL